MQTPTTILTEYSYSDNISVCNIRTYRDAIPSSVFPSIVQITNHSSKSYSLIKLENKIRVKRPFSNCEKTAIIAGVSMYGEGQWTLIKQNFSKELSTRTTVNIKDCYRNLKKKLKTPSAPKGISTRSKYVCPHCGK
jgi:hypothetical protein